MAQPDRKAIEGPKSATYAGLAEGIPYSAGKLAVVAKEAEKENDSFDASLRARRDELAYEARMLASRAARAKLDSQSAEKERREANLRKDAWRRFNVGEQRRREKVEAR